MEVDSLTVSDLTWDTLQSTRSQLEEKKTNIQLSKNPGRIGNGPVLFTCF